MRTDTDFESRTGWKYPIPPRSTSVVAVKHNGSCSSPVVEKCGKIGVSDSNLMGVLAAMGHDPITDNPIIMGDRAWWWFDDDGDGALRKKCVAYYGSFTGDISHLSFCRKALEMAKGFISQAKEGVSRSRGYEAGNIRRL